MITARTILEVITALTDWMALSILPQIAFAFARGAARLGLHQEAGLMAAGFANNNYSVLD